MKSILGWFLILLVLNAQAADERQDKKTILPNTQAYQIKDSTGLPQNLVLYDSQNNAKFLNGKVGSPVFLQTVTSSTGNTGNITIETGSVEHAAFSSGVVIIRSNDNTLGATGGINLFTGEAGGTSGTITLQAGSTPGTKGEVILAGRNIVLLPDSGTGVISAGSERITLVKNPSVDTDAATKDYADRTKSLEFGGASDSTNCTGSPCTERNEYPSGWVSSVTRSGAGVYVVNFTASHYTAAPNCACSGRQVGTTANVTCSAYASTTSLVNVETFVAAIPVDVEVTIICHGST